MVEVTDQTIDDLKEFAESTDNEFQKVKEVFKKNLEEVNEGAAMLSEERREKIAVGATRSEMSATNRTPTSDVEMLTIGGDIRDSGTFVGTALVDEDPDSDLSSKLGVVIISPPNEDDEVNLTEDVYNGFSEVGNIVSGEFSVSESDHLEGHVRVFPGDDTEEIEVTSPDDETRMELIEELREKVQKATIADIADNLTAAYRDDGGNKMSITSDVRRMEVDIYDGYKNPEEGHGTYTVRDETVWDEEDLRNSPVYDAEEANENATPGLTCWVDPQKMVYGSSSVVEMYGTLTSRDGQISMNVHGIVPIFPKGEFDGYDVSEQSNGPSRSEVNTGSVDRTSI